MSLISIGDLRTLADAVCELDAAKGYFITAEQARIEKLIHDSFQIIEAVAGPDIGMIMDQSEEITDAQAQAYKVIYIGASDEQVKWGSNDDPRGLLEEGKEYEVENEEQHSWHTKLYLKDFPGKKFNSVSFKEKEDI